MTDRRYQAAINALIKEKKRKRIGPPIDRGPVEGGEGFAGKAAELVSTAQVFFPVDDAVSGVGPPPLILEPTSHATGALDSERAIPIAEDFYTVHEDVSPFDSILKNNLSFVDTGTYDHIACITGNSTGLLIVDIGVDTTEIPTLHWLSLEDGTETDSLLSGEAWQVGASVDTSPGSINPDAIISANETHFCLPVYGDGSPGAAQGYWLYLNDFTLVAKISFLKFDNLGYQGQGMLTSNHLYVMDSGDAVTPAQDGWRLRVFDLDANLLDTQDFGLDDGWAGFRHFEVTDAYLYMRDPGATDVIRAVPRDEGEVTFDFDAYEEASYTGGSGLGFLSINRDFAAEF